jgi:hypothetical protein
MGELGFDLQEGRRDLKSRGPGHQDSKFEAKEPLLEGLSSGEILSAQGLRDDREEGSLLAPTFGALAEAPSIPLQNSLEREQRAEF